MHFRPIEKAQKNEELKIYLQRPTGGFALEKTIVGGKKNDLVNLLLRVSALLNLKKQKY